MRDAATAMSAQGTLTDDPAVLFNYALNQAAILARLLIATPWRIWPWTGRSDRLDGGGRHQRNVIIASSGQQRVFLVQADHSYRGVGGDTAR